MLAALLVAAALLPGTAFGHAVLTSTVPERGVALETPPEAIELRFNEPVEAKFGALRVFDASGEEVQQGEPFRPGDKSTAVGVALRDGLPDGGYTVTYRVISADSHPISGGFVFSVGEGPAASATVDELLEGSDAGPVTFTALGVARGLQYAAIALGLGTLLFFLLAWMPALRATAGADGAWQTASSAFAGRARRLLVLAALLGTASAVLAVLLQGATATGDSLWAALDAGVVGDILGTRFGTVWGLGALAWLLVLGVTAVPGRRLPALRPASVGATGAALPGMPPALLAALAVPLAFLALLPGLGGHASVQDPRWVVLPANVLHVVAMAAWLGGIAVLVLALRAGIAALAAEQRTRLLAGSVARFSALAGIAIAVIAATGVIQSIVYLESFGDLLDSAFGRAVLVKSGLFLAICGLGFVNRNRLLPQLRRAAEGGETPGRTGVLLRRVLRAELLAGLGVLAATGALASYAPSSAETAGPFSTTASIGPARLDVTVEPARVGANEMHLYLFAKQDGTQFDATRELTVRAELPDKGIEPIELTPIKAGPGHFTISGAAFGVAGDWKVSVTARVSEFDAYDTTLKVPIE